jgi:hypothetical protein
MRWQVRHCTPPTCCGHDPCRSYIAMWDVRISQGKRVVVRNCACHPSGKHNLHYEMSSATLHSPNLLWTRQVSLLHRNVGCAYFSRETGGSEELCLPPKWQAQSPLSDPRCDLVLSFAMLDTGRLGSHVQAGACRWRVVSSEDATAGSAHMCMALAWCILRFYNAQFKSSTPPNRPQGNTGAAQ